MRHLRTLPAEGLVVREKRATAMSQLNGRTLAPMGPELSHINYARLVRRTRTGGSVLVHVANGVGCVERSR